MIRFDLYSKRQSFTVSLLDAKRQALTLFTIRLRLPLKTSPPSTHRFHAHRVDCRMT